MAKESTKQDLYGLTETEEASVRAMWVCTKVLCVYVIAGRLVLPWDS